MAVRWFSVEALSSEDLAIVKQVATETCTLNTARYESRIEELEEKVREQDDQLSRASRAARGPGAGVAFSAIMQHDMDQLGALESLVFNDVLINDGQGYNNITGAFTAPVNGAYTFMAFIGQRGQNEIFARITKNGSPVVEIGAQGMDPHQDTQAGNAAILFLLAGDVVQVKHHLWGSHIEGDLPLTTFSGFLLYDTEETIVVG